MQFLSSEGKALIGIKDIGQWKFYAVERFKGILDLVAKRSAHAQNRTDYGD
jgi:hypothetical protein